LNCTVLGAEVQHCQSLGKRVLLSLKADSPGAVGGNMAFGDPNARKEPFGPAFASGSVAKRQVDAPVGAALPVINITHSPRPMGPGPVMNPPLHAPVVVVEVNPLPSSSVSTIAPSATPSAYPNLFDSSHPPSALALTFFSLFSEGHTERADLRPLGPDAPSGSSPPVLHGTDWVNPVLPELQRPLGEEVVVDGFDVQIPAEWKGSFQDGQFADLVTRLKTLLNEAWRETGEVVGGPADLGADGKGVVYSGFVGGPLKVRSRGLTVRTNVLREGWAEWNPLGV
jgi:hypothetical protein